MLFAWWSTWSKFQHKPLKKKHQQKVKTSKIIEQKVNASTYEVTTNNSGLRKSSNGAFFLQFDVKVQYTPNKKKILQEVKTSTLIQQKVNASIHEVTINNSGLRDSFSLCPTTTITKNPTGSTNKCTHSTKSSLTANKTSMQTSRWV